MIDILVLIKCVISLFLMIIPAFLIKKYKLIGDSFAKGLSNLVLYVAQPALILFSFIRPFEKSVLYSALGVLVFSFIAHTIFYLISTKLFIKTEKQKRKVLQFCSIFSNAGYMGAPLVMAVLDEKAAIFPIVYTIGFNYFTWTLGCLIYTEDKSYISLKKIFFNPASIPLYIGLIIFFTPIDAFIPSFATDAISMLKNLVAPLSMMIIGIKLADTDFKGVFKDFKMMGVFLLRLIIFPCITFLVMYIGKICSIYSDYTAFSSTMICASTPCATMAVMFAEKFDGDGAYASKIVAISTILSIITIPIVCLLLYLL